MDRVRLRHILGAIGDALTAPARICVIGSAPAMLYGQSLRTTNDIDVWRPGSDYDATDFERACVAAGLLFDPRAPLSPTEEYVQIVDPGVVRLPKELNLEVLGRYGKLEVFMPKPELLVASKMTRAESRDIGDASWWLQARRMSIPEIDAAIDELPDASDRANAHENMIIIRVLLGSIP